MFVQKSLHFDFLLFVIDNNGIDLWDTKVYHNPCIEWNGEIRVISVSLTSNIYHCFMMRTFKISLLIT